MTERVQINIENHIAHVRLSRADKMNALDAAMFDGIIDAIEQLQDPGDARVVVLSGEGPSFCAGLDLSNFQGAADKPQSLAPRTYGDANRFQQVGWGWRTVPVPVIAAAHGVVFGGGMQILAGADIRILHPESRCAVMEMRWGLVPDMAGYPLWRGNVRDDVLRQLVYTNAEFSGEQAQAWGFATEVSADPLARAMELAAVIADKNPDAIRAAKRLSNQMMDASDAELLLAESVEQDKIIYHPNQIEAVSAEFEKRRPQFT